MPEVRWSSEARAKLGAIDSAVRDQLASRADEILHYMPPVVFPHDEGFVGRVMWHRGIACGVTSEELLALEDDDGPWNYFLFYRPGYSAHEDPDPGYFEVLDICRINEVAERWG